MPRSYKFWERKWAVQRSHRNINGSAEAIHFVGKKGQCGGPMINDSAEAIHFVGKRDSAEAP